MESGRRTYDEIAAGTTPAALERFKLERLFELRAVITALRLERAPDAPHPVFGQESRFRQ